MPPQTLQGRAPNSIALSRVVLMQFLVQRCDNNLVDKTGAVAVLTHLLPVQRCANLQSGL